jgi:predicted small secreted protein
MRHWKRWIAAAAACVALWACGGCHTVRGLGQDLQQVGQWLEDAGGP